MKKALLLFSALTSLLVLPLVSMAKTYSCPTAAPLFTVDFPDDWKVTADKEECDLIGLSPDETVEYYIWKFPVTGLQDKNLKEVVRDEMETVAEEIKKYCKNPKIGQFEPAVINGINYIQAEGTAKYRDGGESLSIQIDLFTPDGKALFGILYYGSKGGEKTYQAQIEAIDKSIKKVGAK